MPTPKALRCPVVGCPGMRRAIPLALALTIAATTAAAVIVRPVQAQALAAGDSSLIGRILLAEDRRDSTDVALAEGARHADARVQVLSRRALARIRDPKFAERSSFAPLPAAPTWPEPAWRLRLRALTAARDDCGALRSALADPVWPVRLRAAAVVRASCADDAVIRTTLRAWVTGLPARTGTRVPDGVSWHAGAHGFVALARLWPAEARPLAPALIAHAQWQVRQYAARGAGLLGDTVALRHLAADPDDNVAEVAIEQLARLTRRADDSLFVRALAREGAQVVRVAATALKGSVHPDAPRAARSAFGRFVARDNASARDARLALLEVLGEPATADVPPRTREWLPSASVADAVRLALGADVRLLVTMDATAGGGSFEVRLRGDAAPLMGARLLALARRGYYDGLTWHRVEHDFVIQGGSPGANEYVGADRYLRDELGGVSHVRGTVGMSTRGHDTGDAQWFVNLRDNARLDGDYTVWAEVLRGIEVVDAVLEGDRIARVTEVTTARANR